jgi:imidazoleglycerol-phosphate dehydratase/histidinol-phosphatase
MPSYPRVIFIDRDGTIIREPADYCINSYEKLDFLPGVIRALSDLSDLGWHFILVTNQDGLGTEAFPRAEFDGPHALMKRVLAGEGVTFLRECIDEHYPHENHPNRKPNTGMVDGLFLELGIDPQQSVMIGDRRTDAEFAHRLGIRSITIKDPGSADGDLKYADNQVYPTRLFTSWADVLEYFRAGLPA